MNSSFVKKSLVESDFNWNRHTSTDLYQILFSMVSFSFVWVFFLVLFGLGWVLAFFSKVTFVFLASCCSW